MPEIDVKIYPGSPEYLLDLATGRIDAVLNDSLLAGYLLKNTTLPLKAGTPIGTTNKIGLPLQKGDLKFQATL